jgi:hypothetical protein
MFRTACYIAASVLLAIVPAGAQVTSNSSSPTQASRPSSPTPSTPAPATPRTSTPSQDRPLPSRLR